MQGFNANIEKDTLENENFRKVLYTGKNSQLVLMSLKPKEDIGEEVHDVDQFFRIESGKGQVIIDGNVYDVSDGSAVIIPAGSKHNVKNIGGELLQMYTIYSPPHHADKTIHKTKKDALVSDEHFDGKTTEVKIAMKNKVANKQEVVFMAPNGSFHSIKKHNDQLATILKDDGDVLTIKFEDGTIMTEVSKSDVRYIGKKSSAKNLADSIFKQAQQNTAEYSLDDLKGAVQFLPKFFGQNFFIKDKEFYKRGPYQAGYFVKVRIRDVIDELLQNADSDVKEIFWNYQGTDSLINKLIATKKFNTKKII
jgi:mannose-6-phosphate isomerase-like protein (cupin superfamily)